MTNVINNVYFKMFVEVKGANPNGDPMRRNLPRTVNGVPHMTSVCIKRKIRDRLSYEGQKILIKSSKCEGSPCPSVMEEISKEKGKDFLKRLCADKDIEEALKEARDTWYDVRAFGQMFTIKLKEEEEEKEEEKKGKKKGKEKKYSGNYSVRGPISINESYSINKIKYPINEQAITRAIPFKSGEVKEDNEKSDTMGGSLATFPYAVFVIEGGINSLIAEKVGFTQADVDIFKNSLIGMFDVDVSYCRPEGSMTVVDVYWIEQTKPGRTIQSGILNKGFKITHKSDTENFYDDFEIDITLIEKMEGVKISKLKIPGKEAL